ncbi:hypothetical protein [Niallia endozanthoxylica]|uniref:Uncharacterized protein n=1 Tax=Niallia endozanthoxylica TaxID=2036016 RepID=A0A5J5HX43_9BACI|nr:hypothetical protein [Niallia endozanthoxylica]KAA9026293.1 hypothetical protein F4V44_10520 [Niallia endozanthoxylica]
MGRVLSILAIGMGGYYLFQKRFRVINAVLGNSMMRRFFVRSLMNIPAIRNRMMGSVFSQGPKPI